MSGPQAWGPKPLNRMRPEYTILPRAITISMLILHVPMEIEPKMVQGGNLVELYKFTV